MKKFIAAFINITSAVIAILTLCIIQTKFPQENIIAIMNAPVFEFSEDYYSLVNERINAIFTLISLKIPFETNNEINHNKVIAQSLSKDGTIKEWTIDDCLNVATSHGIFINPKYEVDRIDDKNSLPFNKNTSYNFMFKTYPTTNRTGFSTEENFINEVMTALAKYYKTNSLLESKTSNFLYNVSFYDENDENPITYNNTPLSNKDLKNSNAFLFISSKDNILSSNITNITSQTMKTLKQHNPYPDKEFDLCCGIDTNFSKNDELYKQFKTYNAQKSECSLLITILSVALVFFLISLIVTLYFILLTKKTVNEVATLFYKIPMEIHILLYITITAFLITLIIKGNLLENFSDLIDLSTIKIYLYMLVIYSTTLIFFIILTMCYATDNLMPLSLKTFKEGLNEEKTYLPPIVLFIFVFIPIVSFIILSIYMLYLYMNIGRKNILIISIFLLITTILFVLFLLLLYNSFNKALKAQKNANEMRTSLISNVSHDIKTPLTSIINYTQLIVAEIKKPTKNFNKNVLHYSEVITDRSNRLNDLINDLIFDSKASTGNVEFNMEKIDLVSFLTQIIVEFEDKLKERKLKIIFTHNKIDSAVIFADSVQLYRVFQNLFSNIYKYALEKSRVYFDLDSVKSKYITTIKNIQIEKLEVSVDALKDKFVRGNKSRNTEGFGLGLSIAENLITSMNGKFDISNVRDEFITKITFVAYEN